MERQRHSTPPPVGVTCVNQPASIFFDLDGTLLDTEVLWAQAARDFLQAHDVPCSQAEATALVYGRSWHDIYADLARQHPHLATGVERVGGELRDVLRRLRAQTDVCIRGSVDLLVRLAAAHPVAIVSGSPRADIADSVVLMGIAPCVRFFLGAEDYSPGKPDPACFLMAARRMQVDPSACLVFEDSTAGVRAAKAAGMACVALVRPDAPRQDVTPADLVLDDLGTFDLERFSESMR